MCTLCSMNPNYEANGGHALFSNQGGTSLPILGDASTSSVFATTNSDVNGILYDTKWSSTNLTFSFPNSISDYDSFDQSEHGSSFSQFDASQQASVEFWLDQYAAVSGLTFTENTGASDEDAVLKFANGNASTAFAFLPTSDYWGGDSWYGGAGVNPQFGDYDFTTIGHEIGHALGLVHPHENTNPFGTVSSGMDSMQYSIMSYRAYIGAPLTGYTNSTFSYAQTLMMLDIAAIQHMYGANYSTNNTNTTYSWDPSTGAFSINGVQQFDAIGGVVFQTIWDGGGTDTYNFGNFTTDLYIDLAPGGYVDLDTNGNTNAAELNFFDNTYSEGQIYNALLFDNNTASLIENAVGGSGEDEIHGNEGNNKIYGNAGDDIIYGYGGNDVLVGNGQNDTLYGGNNNDKLRGFTKDDMLYGENGNDLLNGGRGNDELYGGSGQDTLRGLGGDDIINGGLGDDELTSGPGSDIFIFDSISSTQTDTIMDYNSARDTIRIVGNYDENDLDITTVNGTDAQVEIGNTTIIVKNAAGIIMEDSFEFVSSANTEFSENNGAISGGEMISALSDGDERTETGGDMVDDILDRAPETSTGGDMIAVLEVDEMIFEI
ncbi:MAG: reprolysin-like metallopeptidase [Pseudomonadota bacterium]